jgi:hypothetical protein
MVQVKPTAARCLARQAATMATATAARLALAER